MKNQELKTQTMNVGGKNALFKDLNYVAIRSFVTLFFAAILFICSSCDNQDPGTNYPTRRLPYRGMTMDQVVDSLGLVAVAFDLKIDDLGDELRAPLLDKLDDLDQAEGFTIKEYQWERGSIVTIVWFGMIDGEWIAIDATEIPEDMTF